MLKDPLIGLDTDDDDDVENLQPRRISRHSETNIARRAHLNTVLRRRRIVDIHQVDAEDAYNEEERKVSRKVHRSGEKSLNPWEQQFRAM